MQAVAATPEKPHQRRRGKPLEPPKKPFTRAAARAYTHATRTQRASTSARRKHVARTDGAQHVTKPPQRGQIRVLWSKSVNVSTARQPLKIGALQAAKRQAGQRAHAQRAKGARQAAEKRAAKRQRGARCTTRRRANANTPPNALQGGKKRRRRRCR